MSKTRGITAASTDAGAMLTNTAGEVPTYSPVIGFGAVPAHVDFRGVSDARADMPFTTNFQRSIAAKDISAHFVADWIINFCHAHGDVVTNLRLQRLLYFAQAWYLAIHDEPLFKSHFEAWVNGPIQPEVFIYYSHFEYRPINIPRPRVKFPKKIEDHLVSLMTSYGTINSFELELQAQRDLPWMEARGGLPPKAHSTNKIKISTMKSFYRKRLNGKEG